MNGKRRWTHGEQSRRHWDMENSGFSGFSILLAAAGGLKQRGFRVASESLQREANSL
jgi:hypothetical protein